LQFQSHLLGPAGLASTHINRAHNDGATFFSLTSPRDFIWLDEGHEHQPSAFVIVSRDMTVRPKYLRRASLLNPS
jgi:hypothetical protein